MGKSVPDGAVDTGTTCPSCGMVLQTVRGSGQAWCPNPECDQDTFGYIAHLDLKERQHGVER